MTYLGKVFRMIREENTQQFINTFGFPDDKREGFVKEAPTQKLERSEDGIYTLTYTNGNFKLPLRFKLGVEFVENAAKTTFTMEGDTFTQVQKCNDGKTVTIIREFTDNQLKVTFKCTSWDGTAYRYYEAEPETK